MKSKDFLWPYMNTIENAPAGMGGGEHRETARGGSSHGSPCRTGCYDRSILSVWLVNSPNIIFATAFLFSDASSFVAKYPRWIDFPLFFILASHLFFPLWKFTPLIPEVLFDEIERLKSFSCWEHHLKFSKVLFSLLLSMWSTNSFSSRFGINAIATRRYPRPFIYGIF